MGAFEKALKNKMAKEKYEEGVKSEGEQIDVPKKLGYILNAYIPKMLEEMATLDSTEGFYDPETEDTRVISIKRAPGEKKIDMRLFVKGKETDWKEFKTDLPEGKIPPQTSEGAKETIGTKLSNPIEYTSAPIEVVALQNQMDRAKGKIVVSDLANALMKAGEAGDKMAGDMGKEKALMDALGQNAGTMWEKETLKKSFMEAVKDPGRQISNPALTMRSLSYQLRYPDEAKELLDSFNAKDDWKVVGTQEDND